MLNESCLLENVLIDFTCPQESPWRVIVRPILRRQSLIFGEQVPGWMSAYHCHFQEEREGISSLFPFGGLEGVLWLLRPGLQEGSFLFPSGKIT